MAKSLQEQLMGSGLIDKKKAKAIGKEKRKQAKQTPKGHEQENEVKQAVKQAQVDKAERARKLNLERQQAAESKAILAQIKQLVDVNKISRHGGDIDYSFSHGSTIKKIMVGAALQKQLERGHVAIVCQGENYYPVPKPVADKIAQRDASLVVVQNEKPSNQVDEDDPYADFPIPDDLMW